MRLGCETYSGDINPVSVLIQKCILEFPQKFGNRSTENNMAAKHADNGLLKDVKKWSDWVLDEALEEIGKFYPQADTAKPAGYITARTVPCQNRECGAEIPLMPNYWLARKPHKKVAACPYAKGRTILFRIVGDGYDPMPGGFDPDKGTISKATAVCIACGSVIDPKTMKKIFWKKASWDKQIVVILSKTGTPGKTYRPSNSSDLAVCKEAHEYLKAKRDILYADYDLDPIPDEVIQTPDGAEYKQGGIYWQTTEIMLYGLTRWKHLFNPRQMLSMITFAEKIRQAHSLMLNSGYGEEYARVVVTYLGIMLDKLADRASNLARYDVMGEKIQSIFGRQSFAMIWHYVEINPFANSGWKSMQDWVLKVVEHSSNIEKPAAKIAQESALGLSYPDNYFDAVFTDPPYYDNIFYSTLSDFFYVWLKRSIGHLYPELFSTPLTPKSDEVVANFTLVLRKEKTEVKSAIPTIKTKDDFENGLSQSFKEIYRVLKNDGIAVIVYAHKSTDGWETLINSILESGLLITGAWPIRTEMKGRMIANDSAALASSIYMVARKSKKEEHGFYRDVKKDMAARVESKLETIWKQRMSGADFFISAMGASIQVFGRYEKVTDDSDEPVTTIRLLNDVRKIVTDYAINHVLRGGFGGEVSQITRFYVLWRYAYGHSRVQFGDALKLAQSVGLDLERESSKGLIKKDKAFVKVLEPNERKIEDIGSHEMIDVLHRSALLWKCNKKQNMLRILEESGFGGSDVFYKVAQALVEANPGSPESRLLSGFLSSRETIMDSTLLRDPNQTRLPPRTHAHSRTSL